VSLRAVAEDPAGNRAITNFRVDVTLDDTLDGSSVTDPRADADLSLSSSAPSLSATGRFVSYSFLSESGDYVIRVEDFGENAASNPTANFLTVFAPSVSTFFSDTSISNDSRTVAIAYDADVFVFRYSVTDQEFQQIFTTEAASPDSDSVELSGEGDILVYEDSSNLVVVDIGQPARRRIRSLDLRRRE
jgi:hypothetical protein